MLHGMLGFIVRNPVFNLRMFNSIYMSWDQEKINSKGLFAYRDLIHMLMITPQSVLRIFFRSVADNVTTCIAWTFQLTGKIHVKPLRLSTWLKSASQDCHVQTLLGFSHWEWSKDNWLEIRYLGNKAKRGELFYYLTTYSLVLILSCKKGNNLEY